MKRLMSRCCRFWCLRLFLFHNLRHRQRLFPLLNRRSGQRNILIPLTIDPTRLTRPLQYSRPVRPRRHRIVNPHDPLDRIPPLITRIDSDPIFPPAQFPLAINNNLIKPPLLSSQVPNLHMLQPLPRALFNFHILSLTLIKPVKEVLLRRSALPLGMIFP